MYKSIYYLNLFCTIIAVGYFFYLWNNSEEVGIVLCNWSSTSSTSNSKFTNIDRSSEIFFSSILSVSVLELLHTDISL